MSDKPNSLTNPQGKTKYLWNWELWMLKNEFAVTETYKNWAAGYGIGANVELFWKEKGYILNQTK